MKDQCYAYAKQAGIKENELEYVEIGSGQIAAEAGGGAGGGEPTGCRPGRPGQVALYRAQGHLLEVTDVVEKMQQVPGGLFDVSLNAVMHKGKAYGIPQSVSPSPLVTRLDILEAAKVDPAQDLGRVHRGL